MSFNVNYSKQAKSFLKSSDKLTLKRLLKKVEVLAKEPINRDTKKIEGSKGLFRVRVGSYRILYEIDYSEQNIGIVKIDKRDEVYR